MKKAWLILVLVGAFPAWCANTTSKVVDCGDNKAVPFDETASPDSRHIIGWTILVQNKKAKPVDWSKWNADDPWTFLDAYVPDSEQETGDKDDYAFVDCIIDLKGKKLVVLPSNRPSYPKMNRGHLVAAWSKSDNGRQYALIENDARFFTANFWLVTIDSKGMHENDLVNDFNKVVAPILRNKRPLSFGEYGTIYDADELVKGITFGTTSVTLPFESDIPKSLDEATGIEGNVTFRLPGGAVIRAWSDAKRDDPMQDMPELGRADRELNELYQKLQQKLGPAQQAELKNDQLIWIGARDNAADNALSDALNDPTAHDPHDVRNKVLLKWTQNRVREFKGRLDALH